MRAEPRPRTPSRSRCTKGRRYSPRKRCARARAGRYTVFTPFARAFAGHGGVSSSAAAALGKPAAVARGSDGGDGSHSDLRSPRDHAQSSRAPGRETAGAREARALPRRARHARTTPSATGCDLAGTSRLSADLKFGTLSVLSVWTAISTRRWRTKRRSRSKCVHERATLARVHPRFALGLPASASQAVSRQILASFRGSPTMTRGGAPGPKGATGYPVVDAAARHNYSAKGFVHNRARMIAASFLTKHQLIPLPARRTALHENT